MSQAEYKKLAKKHSIKLNDDLTTNTGSTNPRSAYQGNEKFDDFRFDLIKIGFKESNNEEDGVRFKAKPNAQLRRLTKGDTVVVFSKTNKGVVAFLENDKQINESQNMENLATLIESGDFDAANKLIKKQLNETVRTQSNVNTFLIQTTGSDAGTIRFEVNHDGSVHVNASYDESDEDTYLHINKKDFAAFVEFLKTNKNVSALNEAAKEYESSIDFTNDMNKALFELKKMKTLLESPKWKAWMKSTDDNFSARVNFVRESDKVLEKIKAAEKAFLDLETEIGDVD